MQNEDVEPEVSKLCGKTKQNCEQRLVVFRNRVVADVGFRLLSSAHTRLCETGTASCWPTATLLRRKDFYRRAKRESRPRMRAPIAVVDTGRGTRSSAVRTIDSRQDEPAESLPGFSHVGIVADDAADRRVFSGISRYPHTYRPRFALTGLRVDHDGNNARLARRSDGTLGVRVSVARIAPSLLDLGRAVCRTLMSPVACSRLETVVLPGERTRQLIHKASEHANDTMSLSGGKGERHIRGGRGCWLGSALRVTARKRQVRMRAQRRRRDGEAADTLAGSSDGDRSDALPADRPALERAKASPATCMSLFANTPARRGLTRLGVLTSKQGDGGRICVATCIESKLGTTWPSERGKTGRTSHIECRSYARWQVLLSLLWHRSSLQSAQSILGGATVAERLACSPPTKANRVRSSAGPLPHLSHVGIMLDDATGRRVFLGDLPFPPALPFRRCSILNSITYIGFQDIANKYILLYHQALNFEG
ncbi:hypothetical protein PR048_022035, partial [Dryococelus australis]